jgi:tetratricopeptide (TPR) repeat protein
MAADVHAGIEIAFIPALAIRAGLGQGVPAVGTRIRWRDFSLDYVYESNGLDDLHRLGVALSFGSTVAESRMTALRREQEELDARLNIAFAQRQEKQVSVLIANAEATFHSGRYDEALEILSVVSVLVPDDDAVLRLRIRYLLATAQEVERNENFAEAAVIFGQALALDPEHREAAAGSERCRSESNRLADRSARIQSRFSEGLDAFTMGDLMSARQIFKEILESRPTDAEASQMLARTNTAIERRAAELEDHARRYIRAGTYAEAEAALAEATRLTPESPSVRTARIALAEARNESRKPRKAAPAPSPDESGAPRTPELTPEQREEMATFYENGVAAINEGHTQDAIRYWEWVHSMDPHYRRVKEYLKREYHLLGIQAFSEGRLTEAVGFWERALRVDPEDAKTKVYLERARQHLERSREISGAAAQ